MIFLLEINTAMILMAFKNDKSLFCYYFIEFIQEVQDYRPENEVVTQLNWIRINLLSKYDPELKQHLEKLDIPLPLFGMYAEITIF